MSSLPLMDMQRDYYEEPKKPEGKKNLSLLLKVLIILLLLFFVGEVGYYVFLSQSMLIEEIQVKAPEGFVLSNKQIVALSGFSGNESVFTIDTEAMEIRLKTYPSVLDAVIQAQFPNKLIIEVIPRIPAAALIVGETSQAFCIDKEGVLFRSPFPETGLPVLSGIKAGTVRYGDRIHDSIVPMLEDLDELRESSPVMYNLISEIQIKSIGDQQYEGLMFFSHSKVKVRTDLSFSKEQMENIILMIDLVEKQGIASGIEELDFRSETVVLKMREE